MFYVVQDKDQLILGDQRYGYKMLMYLLCTVPTELWARLARLDITCPLALWNPPNPTQKEERECVLFALERRPFKVNKPEKWQTLYNEELPEKTHSAPEFTWSCLEMAEQENRNKSDGEQQAYLSDLH